jgi:hypothetical protein
MEEGWHGIGKVWEHLFAYYSMTAPAKIVFHSKFLFVFSLQAFFFFLHL